MRALTPIAPTTYAVASYRACAYAQPVSVGQNIKKLRAERHLSQTALAKRLSAVEPPLEIGPGRVSEWESARYKAMELKTLMRLGIALGCSMDALLEGVNTDYDAVVSAPRTPPQSAPPISAEDRELLEKLHAAELEDAAIRQQALIFLGLEGWLRETTTHFPSLPRTQPQSQPETTPAPLVASGGTHRKRGRARRDAGGKRR